MTTLTRRRPTTATAPRHGGPLTGTAALVRFMLRRDRLRIPLWVGGLTLLTVAVMQSLIGIYATAADRRAVAQTLDTPASVAMTGVNYAGVEGYTYGAMLGHQMLWFTVVLAAMMSVLLIVRHTRAEEATGRAELVRSGVVGRHAATAAAVVVVALANVALAAAMAAGLAVMGVESVTWSGSLLYGAAHAAVGLVFAGVAVVAAQVTEHTRGASAMGMAAIGLAYGLRAIGDTGAATLSWLSPIGWAQATRVYVDDRWWPLLLAVAAAIALVAAGVALSDRRDVGAGLRHPRPGRSRASAALVRPLGFALRLQRASLIGWAIGMFVIGVMYGSVLGDAEQMLTDVEGLAEFLHDVAGVGITETFAAMVMIVTAIIASAYALLAAQRMRSEETAGRAEPVLSTALSRVRWAGSHLVVAAAGSVGVLIAAGLGLGLAGAAATEDATLLPKLVGAALSYVPALWVTVGAVAALFGLLPRAIPLAWILVLYSFFVVYLGGLLDFPDWMTNLSPFGHVARYPAEDFSPLPLVALTAVAAALAAVGLAAFARRDVQSPT